MIRAQTRLQRQGMPAAPTEFAGTLSELFDQHIRAALPSRDSVLRFHEWMCRYADARPEMDGDRVFPVRAIARTVRREVVQTGDGTRIAPADNSPAWVVHALLVGAEGEHPLSLNSWADFHRLMTGGIATHMFDVSKCVRWSANSFGWYMAHVLPANNGDTAWQDWTHCEVTRRFFRTLHPCNLFLVPGVRNRQMGESVEVIAFMAARLADRYGIDLWNDFANRSLGLFPSAAPGGALRSRLRELTTSGASHVPTGTDACLNVKARYRASRLTFRRDVIEALADDDAFEVVTLLGLSVLQEGNSMPTSRAFR